ncbi:hypothetical protein B0H17DRAFT_1212799 [Mycena rosella]|uniref:Uncharacterized protein n=1 Tax=Mycena rosella TaxID=1033263 RepID=A0AAD7CR54_MYCRO|nr:hypothetical protein B0H17DRAFT_1212799 [Mycena rosella]
MLAHTETPPTQAGLDSACSISQYLSVRRVTQNPSPPRTVQKRSSPEQASNDFASDARIIGREQPPPPPRQMPRHASHTHARRLHTPRCAAYHDATPASMSRVRLPMPSRRPTHPHPRPDSLTDTSERTHARRRVLSVAGLHVYVHAPPCLAPASCVPLCIRLIRVPVCVPVQSPSCYTRQPHNPTVAHSGLYYIILRTFLRLGYPAARLPAAPACHAFGRTAVHPPRIPPLRFRLHVPPRGGHPTDGRVGRRITTARIPRYAPVWVARLAVSGCASPCPHPSASAFPCAPRNTLTDASRIRLQVRKGRVGAGVAAH